MQYVAESSLFVGHRYRTIHKNVRECAHKVLQLPRQRCSVPGVVGPETSDWRATWLYDLRLSRPPIEGKKKLTQAEFADELVRKGISLGADPRVRYNRLEKGRDTLSDELLAELAALYGVPMPKPPTVDTTDPVVAAIDRQTEQLKRQADAIFALVARLENLALGQTRLAEEIGAIVDPELARRRLEAAQSEMPPERHRPDPAESKGGK